MQQELVNMQKNKIPISTDVCIKVTRLIQNLTRMWSTREATCSFVLFHDDTAILEQLTADMHAGYIKLY